MTSHFCCCLYLELSQGSVKFQWKSENHAACVYKTHWLPHNLSVLHETFLNLTPTPHTTSLGSSLGTNVNDKREKKRHFHCASQLGIQTVQPLSSQAFLFSWWTFSKYRIRAYCYHIKITILLKNKIIKWHGGGGVRGGNRRSFLPQAEVMILWSVDMSDFLEW